MKIAKLILILLVPVTVLTGIVAVGTHAVPYRVYIIHTGSMSPNIPPESAVVVHVGQYHVGQVISFNTYDGVVTHRLMSLKDGMITTKGDGNPTADPWKLPVSNIIGGVIFSPPKVGYWIIYLKSPLGLASVVLGILLCWQIWSLTSQGIAVPKHRIGVASTRNTSGPRHRLGSNQTAWE